MIFLFVSIKVYLVILFTNIKRGVVKMNEQEIYVDNDLLGQQILFRSATGERLGFFNSRIVSMLDFAEDRLNIRTAPKNYEKVREIRYKDIASVDVKRHMSILYIILFILLAIGAIFSMGITLVIDVVLFWSVFGSKLVITTKSGSKYSFVTLWAPKTYQDFTEALRQTVERANTGEYLVANEEKSENIVERLFIQRDMDMSKTCKESWNIMVDELCSGKTTDELISSLYEKCSSNSDFTYPEKNNTFYSGVCQVLSNAIGADEKIILAINSALRCANPPKKFIALTSERIIFYYNKRIHSVAYEDVYKLSFMSPPNSWFVNSFPPNGEEMFMMVSGTFGADIMGLILALISRFSDEKSIRGHKIVIMSANDKFGSY